jgi:DNA-binding transcriptional ArsR family regulator
MDGTKEEILNLVAEEPKTISQLSKELDLAPPSVHKHVNELMASELLRESSEWEKQHPKERYYEPNFPVIKADEAVELCAICQDLAGQVASLFRKRRRQFERAFRETALAERGWEFGEVAQFMFAKVQRGARELLEADGTLAPRRGRRNGAAWVFWAEEPRADASK